MAISLGILTQHFQTNPHCLFCILLILLHSSTTGWWCNNMCNNHLEKWWSSSMGRMTSHIWNGKYQFMFETTNQTVVPQCSTLILRLLTWGSARWYTPQRPAKRTGTPINDLWISIPFPHSSSLFWVRWISQGFPKSQDPGQMVSNSWDAPGPLSSPMRFSMASEIQALLFHQVWPHFLSSICGWFKMIQDDSSRHPTPFPHVSLVSKRVAVATVYSTRTKCGHIKSCRAQGFDWIVDFQGHGGTSYDPWLPKGITSELSMKTIINFPIGWQFFLVPKNSPESAIVTGRHRSSPSLQRWDWGSTGSSRWDPEASESNPWQVSWAKFEKKMVTMYCV